MTKITRTQAIRAVEDAVKRFPDNVNPTTDEGCANTSWEDPNHHCIAAQVVVDLGYGKTLTFADNSSTIDQLAEAGPIPFEDDALEALVQIQEHFDQSTWNNLTWAHAWALIKERFVV